MEKTIEIPEGYEARIEGNKVILEPNDEKIRSFLYEFIKVCGWSEKQYPPREKCLAYLEKQKEQKPAEVNDKEIELSDFESELFSAFSDGWQQYLRGEEVNVAQWAKEHSAELLNAAKQELKPAEWSEEDVEKLAKIRASKSGTLKTEITFYRQGVRDAFNYKGFRPAWKPSKEDFAELTRIKDSMPNNEWGNQAEGVLDELIDNLKKL